jgi:alkylation response protein AidB-like acyl-CoA dehydrogenase
MDFTLTEEQQQRREEIVRFAQQELNEGVVQRDKEHAFSEAQWLKCGEKRLHGLPIPEEYGGCGLDALSTALALEAFGYGCEDSGLVFAISALMLACAVPIWKFGTEEQKRCYLPKLCNGTLIGVNAMSEPEAGSDVFSMTTSAVPDGDGYRLNGKKTFCSNGPIADLVVLYAVTDAEKGFHGGITAFLVEKGTPGFRVGQSFEKMGLRTFPVGELICEEVYVPASAILGGLGAGATLFTHSMDWERICLFASHIGTMERLLKKAIQHARTRKQFGQPIGKFQAVSHRIADMKVQLEAARLLTYRSAWRLDRSRSISLDAAMTKLFVSEAYVKTALDLMQTFGGYGFMKEFEIERAVRDALPSTIYSGTSDMQRNIIARWLGL